MLVFKLVHSRSFFFTCDLLMQFTVHKKFAYNCIHTGNLCSCQNWLHHSQCPVVINLTEILESKKFKIWYVMMLEFKRFAENEALGHATTTTTT